MDYSPGPELENMGFSPGPLVKGKQMEDWPLATYFQLILWVWHPQEASRPAQQGGQDVQQRADKVFMECWMLAFC